MDLYDMDVRAEVTCRERFAGVDEDGLFEEVGAAVVLVHDWNGGSEVSGFSERAEGRMIG